MKLLLQLLRACLLLPAPCWALRIERGVDDDAFSVTPESVVDRYVRAHGRDAVHREFATDRKKVCERKYTVAHVSCPQQFGNRMGETLNNLALAIITDHTVLLQYTNLRGNCSLYLNHSRLLMTIGEAQHLHSQAGCAGPRTGIEHCVPSTWDLVHGIGGPVDQACANMTFTAKFEHQETAFLAQNLELRSSAREKAVALFREGPYRGFHALFTRTFIFTRPVVEPVDGLLKTVQDDYKIGVHVRHGIGCSGHCTGIDKKAIGCVKKLVADSSATRCTVLIASDWEETFELIKSEIVERKRVVVENRLQQAMTEFEQTMQHFRDATGCRVVSTVATEHVKQTSFEDDHGKFTGITAMMDAYMLSRADALALQVGSSSFSERIGEIFASSSSRASKIYNTGACKTTMYDIQR